MVQTHSLAMKITFEAFNNFNFSIKLSGNNSYNYNITGNIIKQIMNCFTKINKSLVAGSLTTTIYLIKEITIDGKTFTKEYTFSNSTIIEGNNNLDREILIPLNEQYLKLTNRSLSSGGNDLMNKSSNEQTSKSYIKESLIRFTGNKDISYHKLYKELKKLESMSTLKWHQLLSCTRLIKDFKISIDTIHQQEATNFDKKN